MKFLQEVTEWEGNIPNHIYVMNDTKSRAVGYIKVGTNSVFTFSKPMAIDLRGRKFKEVSNTFGYIDPTATQTKWEVKGSKGDIYTVQEIDDMLQCSCSGFKFRGQCKHVKEIEDGRK